MDKKYIYIIIILLVGVLMIRVLWGVFLSHKNIPHEPVSRLEESDSNSKEPEDTQGLFIEEKVVDNPDGTQSLIRVSPEEENDPELSKEPVDTQGLFPEERVVDNPDGTQSLIRISPEEENDPELSKELEDRQGLFPEERVVDNPDGTQSLIRISPEEENFR